MLSSKLFARLSLAVAVSCAIQASIGDGQRVWAAGSPHDIVTNFEPRPVPLSEQGRFDAARAVEPTTVRRVSLSIDPVTLVGGELRSSGDAAGGAKGVDVNMGALADNLQLEITYVGTESETWQLTFTDLPGMTADPPAGIFFSSGTQYSDITLDRTGVPLGEYIGTLTLDWGTLPDQFLTIRFEVADVFILNNVFPLPGTPLKAGLPQYFSHEFTVALWSQATGDLLFAINDNKGNDLVTPAGAHLPAPGLYSFIGDGTPIIPLPASNVYSTTYYYLEGSLTPDAQFTQPYDVKGTCNCPFQSDFNGDHLIDNVDLSYQIDVTFFNLPNVQDKICPRTRTDVNCDGTTDNSDLTILIDYLFFNGPAACDPCQ